MAGACVGADIRRRRHQLGAARRKHSGYGIEAAHQGLFCGRAGSSTVVLLEGIPRFGRWTCRRRHHDDPRGALLSGTRRSEEHTSELQSLMRISYAVFCLKKKIKKT